MEMVGDILAKMRRETGDLSDQARTRYEYESTIEIEKPTCHRCGIQHRSPTCPGCGTHNYSRRDSIGESRGVTRDVWDCCYCNTVFSGSADEWENDANREARDLRKRSRERFLALYRERYGDVAVPDSVVVEPPP